MEHLYGQSVSLRREKAIGKSIIHLFINDTDGFSEVL